jgi:hypothetical protein
MKKTNNVETGICRKFLCIVFLGFGMLITTSAYADAPRGQPDGDFSPERMLLQKLGLSEDASDAEILALLDSPNKSKGSVILLIRYKKIYSATPKLLDILYAKYANDGIISVFDKRWAAEALCDFGNRDWVPIIKAMAEDPNSEVNRDSLKYNVAGLLARAGDFSQFDVVAKGLSDEKDFIRSTAMLELSKFAHPTDPVTDKAAELLANYAKNEPNIKFRGYAIEGLEKLAKAKPSLQGKVIESLEANINSTDKDLRAICNVKLKTIYKKPAEPNK